MPELKWNESNGDEDEMDFEFEEAARAYTRSLWIDLQKDDSDLDQNNPVDCSKEVWQDIYSDPDYDLDNDHSMDY